MFNKNSMVIFILIGILKIPMAMSEQNCLLAPLIQKDIQYRRSVEFEALAMQTYVLAGQEISKKLKVQTAEHPAVVLDVDETVLDNTAYQIKTNGIHDAKAWSAWIKSKSSTAVPGVKAFLDLMREIGIQIVFITDRTIDEESDTIENMRALDIFKNSDFILTKKDALDTKNIRRDCVEKAQDPRCQPWGPKTILALIGDSARDFEEFRGNDMESRGRINIVSKAGTLYWIIPNPMYGQWQRDYNN